MMPQSITDDVKKIEDGVINSIRFIIKKNILESFLQLITKYHSYRTRENNESREMFIKNKSMWEFWNDKGFMFKNPCPIIKFTFLSFWSLLTSCCTDTKRNIENLILFYKEQSKNPLSLAKRTIEETNLINVIKRNIGDPQLILDILHENIRQPKNNSQEYELTPFLGIQLYNLGIIEAKIDNTGNLDPNVLNTKTIDIILKDVWNKIDDPQVKKIIAKMLTELNQKKLSIIALSGSLLDLIIAIPELKKLILKNSEEHKEFVNTIELIIEKQVSGLIKKMSQQFISIFLSLKAVNDKALIVIKNILNKCKEDTEDIISYLCSIFKGNILSCTEKRVLAQLLLPHLKNNPNEKSFLKLIATDKNLRSLIIENSYGEIITGEEETDRYTNTYENITNILTTNNKNVDKLPNITNIVISSNCQTNNKKDNTDDKKFSETENQYCSNYYNYSAP